MILHPDLLPLGSECKHMTTEKEYMLVDTCNYGGDYPFETFKSVEIFSSKEIAQGIADEMNINCSTRYVKVVALPYKLDRDDP